MYSTSDIYFGNLCPKLNAITAFRYKYCAYFRHRLLLNEKNFVTKYCTHSQNLFMKISIILKHKKGMKTKKICIGIA
jgi:hypothetical protein